MIVGLTGGVASGKSTVAALFTQLGAHVIDADVVARDVVTQGSPALKAIADYFGPGVLDANGDLNRRAVRDIIFQQPEKRQWLEALLHPLIRQALNERALQSPGPYCILMIPLLYDRSQYPGMQRVIVVDAPPQLQLARLTTRDQVSTAQAQAMIDAQMRREARLAMADDVILNDGQPEHLQAQVKALHQAYVDAARGL